MWKSMVFRFVHGLALVEAYLRAHGRDGWRAAENNKLIKVCGVRLLQTNHAWTLYVTPLKIGLLKVLNYGGEVQFVFKPHVESMRQAREASWEQVMSEAGSWAFSAPEKEVIDKMYHYSILSDDPRVARDYRYAYQELLGALVDGLQLRRETITASTHKSQKVAELV